MHLSGVISARDAFQRIAHKIVVQHPEIALDLDVIPVAVIHINDGIEWDADVTVGIMPPDFIGQVFFYSVEIGFLFVRFSLSLTDIVEFGTILQQWPS